MNGPFRTSAAAPSNTSRPFPVIATTKAKGNLAVPARDRHFCDQEQRLLTKAVAESTLNDWGNAYEKFRAWLKHAYPGMTEEKQIQIKHIEHYALDIAADGGSRALVAFRQVLQYCANPPLSSTGQQTQILEPDTTNMRNWCIMWAEERIKKADNPQKLAENKAVPVTKRELLLLPATMRAAAILWYLMGVRGRTFRAIRRGDVHYSESGEELICFVADDKILGMTNRTVVVECACQDDKEACLIHGARKKELQRNIANNDWADVAEQLHLEYPTITEHSLRRTAALQARRLIESGNHCDIVKFVNDRGWFLVKTFLDYACDLQDWQHKEFLTNAAIWPAVLSASDDSSHGLKFNDRTGITKVTKTLRTELEADPEPAPQKQADKPEPLYVTKAKSATMGKMPQVHKIVPTTRGGKALIPIGAPLTSKKGHNATRKYDGKPWSQLPKGERYKLRTGTWNSMDKASFYLTDINAERIALGCDFIYEIKDGCKHRAPIPVGVTDGARKASDSKWEKGLLKSTSGSGCGKSAPPSKPPGSTSRSTASTSATGRKKKR